MTFDGAVVSPHSANRRRIERFGSFTTKSHLMEYHLCQPTYLIGSRFTKKTFPGVASHIHYHLCRYNTNMLLKIENELLQSHRQRESTGIKKLYNSFFVLF
ncbi:hypothetical protein NE865_12217 [Phthorimaea operculella]|nr:hypothetical protein NE865_12217 [Phthorimaea operculella]